VIILQKDYGSVHNDAITGIGFTSDEKYAFSVGNDKKLIHWNIRKFHKSFDAGQIHVDKITRLEISHDGRWAVTVSKDRKMKQFDILSQCSVKQVCIDYDWGVTHDNFINDCIISPCSKYIFTVSSDLFMKQWNIEQKKLEHNYKQIHDKPVVKICISSNGIDVFTSADDGSVKQFDAKEKTHICNLSQGAL